LDAIDPPKLEPHPTDPVALELAEHARLALQARGVGPRLPKDSDFPPEASLTPAVQRLYLHRAAEHAEHAYHIKEAAQAWLQLGELVEGVAKGEAKRRSAVVLASTGRGAEGEPILHEALAIHRQAASRRLESIVLSNLATIYLDTGRLAQAEHTCKQSLTLAHEVGDRRSEGVVLGKLANIYAHTGHMEQAERTYEQALAIHREVGDRRNEGVALGNLAGVYIQTGRMDQAERAYEQALAITREVGNRRSEGIWLGNLALVYSNTARTGPGHPPRSGQLPLRGDCLGQPGRLDHG
jgi:tetratricopeptide (TPR) repeat protein